MHGKDTSARCVAVRRMHQVSGMEALVKVMKQTDDNFIRKLARKLVADNGFAM